MNLDRPGKRTPQQWLRIALIPTLAAILLVLTRSLVTGDSQAVEALAMEKGEVNSLPTSVVPAATSKWPEMKLADVIAFDPFELPKTEQTRETTVVSSAMDQNAPNRSAAEAASVGEVQAVYIDSRGTAALVDSKVMRVGDMLPDGRRIVEITTQGIRLEGF